MGADRNRSGEQARADDAGRGPPTAAAYDDIDRERVVGSGGFTTVYEATLRTDDSSRRVALKQARPGVDGERVLAEARVCRRLDDHARVPDAVGWGQTPRPWFALEYVPGGDLRSRLDDADDRLPLPTALRVAAQVVDALRHAHRHGVAHLDVAPENVLVHEADEDGPRDVVVADWGLSRRLLADDPVSDGLRPRYAAPEQLAVDGGPVDDRTDVYQAGALLYELLTGRPPHGGSDADGPDRTDPPELPTRIVPALPDAVDRVADRALAPSRADRYESSLDLRRDLNRLRASVGDGDSPPAPSDARPLQAARPTAPADGRSAGAEPAIRPLESQGFLKLASPPSARDASSPATAWRTGPSLADVAAGHTVERTTPADEAVDAVADGDPDGASGRVRVAERLRSALTDGDDAALLGPAGCGKSTVCKRVATRWAARDEAVAYYWRADEPGRIDRPGVLKRAVVRADGPTLVVVEDATRPAATAAFDVAASLVDRSDVVFLFEARESEWHDPGRADLDARANAHRRDRVEPVHLSQPDRWECRRLVERFRALTDADAPLDPGRFLDDLEPSISGAPPIDGGTEEAPDGGTEGPPADGAEPSPAGAAGSGATGRDTYDLLVLVERLTASVRAGADGDAGAAATAPDGPPSRLSEAVDGVYRDLREAGTVALRVGALANLLNALGAPVDRGLLSAVAVEGGDGAGDADAVDRAVDRLAGRMLFDPDPAARGGRPPVRSYDAVQEAWSVEFLDALIDDAGEARAHRLVAACVSSVLSLADDPSRREDVARACQERTPALDRIESDPAEWRDRFVERLFSLGREWPRLAPLFGSPEHSRLDVPDDCGAALRLRCLRWHGEMCDEADRHDRAAAAFRLLREAARDAASAVDADRWLARSELGLGRVAWSRNDYDDAETHLRRALETYREADAQSGAGRALKNLGIVARKRGDYDVAAERQREALAAAREVEDARLAAQTLNELGSVALSRTDYKRAVDRYRESLARRREIGDRSGIAGCLNNLAHVSYRRGEPAAAKDRYRRALAIYRAAGDRRGAAHSLVGIGLVARRQGEHDRAADRFERALEVYRDIDDDESRASCLVNLGVVAESRGNLAAAERRYRSALDAFESIGNGRGRAVSLRNLGEIAHRRGELDAADRLLRRGLDGYRALDSRRGVAMTLVERGVVAFKRGDLVAAAAHARRGAEVAVDAEEVMIEADGLEALGRVRIAADEPAVAVRRLCEALRIRREVDDPGGRAVCRCLLARALAEHGAFDAAAEEAAAARSRLDERPTGPATAEVAFQRATVARLRGDRRAAREAYEAALDAYRETEAAYGEIQCLRELVALGPAAGLDDLRAKCETGRRLAAERGLDDAAVYFRRQREELGEA